MLQNNVETKNFRDRFKDSQNFEDLVNSLVNMAGHISAAGPFPSYTRQEAEIVVLGWSNSLEAVGTILEDKITVLQIN